LLQGDNLPVPEFEIYQAVLRWGKAEAVRQGKADDMEARKTILSRALSLVRFPLMKLEEITGPVTTDGYLSDDDLLDLYRFVSLSDERDRYSSPCPWSAEPRYGGLPPLVVTFARYAKNTLVESNLPKLETLDWSILLWARCDAHERAMLVTKDRVGVKDQEFRLEIYSDGRLGFMWHGAVQSSVRPSGRAIALDEQSRGSDLFSPEPVPIGKWFHIALVRSGDRCRLVVDGVLVSECLLVGGRSARHSNVLNMRIGTRYAASGDAPDRYWWPGLVHQAQFYSGAIATGRIRSLVAEGAPR